MESCQSESLTIEHVESSSPPTFKLIRVSDGKSLLPVAIGSPYEFPVEGCPKSSLMRELRWYLEEFLDYPFHPETDHAEHVLDAVRRWGGNVFNTLFERRDADSWLADSTTLQVRADDPHILSWPWEALYDPKAGAFLAHHRCMERRLNRLPDPSPAADLPNKRINILLVLCRPYDRDVRYRSIARPLIELIKSKNLPVHVDVLRPPTFDQLREHLQRYASYYHVLHFDGHGAYAKGGYSSAREVNVRQGYLIFENETGGPDPKPAKDIKALLRECQVPVVVLNACQSGTLDDQAENAFAAVATAFLQSGVRSVVAMAYSLYVRGAQVFLSALYGRLFGSGSVAEAVRAGRNQMLEDKKRMSARGPYPLDDWLLPVLYQQAPLDFTFAPQTETETHESRLPQEFQDEREALSFIGRDGPILEMERALRRDAPCILVQGLGGVGKTTLARGFIRWLDATGGLDDALWFDFRDIRTAEHVFNRIGERFCGKDFGSRPNKPDLLARCLGQLRVLMVWDNFESAAQNLTDEDRSELSRILDAIRSMRCKVIMTSRSKEDWLGASCRFELPLHGLEGEERWEYAETILREMGLKVNRDDPELQNLMNQLAGHPLAMRVVLPRLEQMTASDVGKALRTNIAELGLNEQEEQGRLFATLRFVEQGLPQDLCPLLGLVGLHEGFLAADFLAWMADRVDPDWTRQRIDHLLEALANAGLVRHIGVLTYYQIHPLLTSYLRSRSAASEACQRAFVYIMGGIASELAPLEYGRQRGLLFAHGANFHFALHLSQRLAMHQDFAELAEILGIYAQNSRNFVEASRLYAQLAQNRVACADWKGESVAYYQMGLNFELQQDFSTAREWYLKSVAIKEKCGDLKGVAQTYRRLGRIAAEQWDFGTAREWFSKSLAISEKQGDLRDVARTYHDLGMIAYEQKDFSTAREWYLKSFAIREKQNDLEDSASTYHELGRIAQVERDFASAQEWYLKSLAIEVKQGNTRGIAISYHQLARIAEDQGSFEKARDLYLESLSISEEQGITQLAAFTYHQLGRVAYEAQDFETARSWYLKSVAVKEKHGDLHGAAMTYGLLGINEARKNDFRDLKDFGEWVARAIIGFRQTQDQREEKKFVGVFRHGYHLASPDEKEKLKAIWLEAGLGPFPTFQGGDDEH